MNDLITLLQELIRIPSPNPPGDCRSIATYIAEWLAPTRATISTVAPPAKSQAESVIATIGDGSAPVIVLHAHIDTVPVAETERQYWTYDPYKPTIRDGKLYGKGAIDDKAPLAAMMLAFERLASLDAQRRGTLILIAAAEEEVGGQLGTRWLVDAGHIPQADFIIVGEQTHNRAATAHKGVARASVTTRGHSVHATNPDRGINAITAMACIVEAFNRYHVGLRQRVHPLVGAATCNVGTIQGGSTTNAVPDVCSITLDRRMIPREDPQAVIEELSAVISSVDVAPAQVEIGDFLFSSWFDSTLETELSKIFLRVIEETLGEKPGPIGYMPGSDAKHLMDVMRGDMVVFGPGSYEVAHSFDEHVEIADLEACEAILTTFLKRALASVSAAEPVKVRT